MRAVFAFCGVEGIDGVHRQRIIAVVARLCQSDGQVKMKKRLTVALAIGYKRGYSVVGLELLESFFSNIVLLEINTT